MEVYSSLLSQDFDRVITIQLLQSSSMLIHNLSKGSSKSELLKTDYFKHVLSHPFDFADSEIVENYMSLLKGIAVNLHLTELRDYLIENNFNLFTGAMIFYNNNETIIRTSARNVVLRVLEGKK
jgi:protein CLEC16A